MRLISVVVTSLALGAGLGFGCGEVVKHELPDAPDAPTYKIGGALAGVAGTGVTVQLNGATELNLTADGSFTFPTELASGDSYEVTVTAAPTCPGRTCTVQNGSGTVGTADVTDVVVTCREPKIRFISHNGGSSDNPSLRISDDVLGIPQGGTAVPRIVTGPNTMLGYSEPDSVALDPMRDLLYVATMTPVAGTNGVPQVLVFENASTLSGDALPARRIPTTSLVQGIEIDSARDRLYLTFFDSLIVLDNASTLDDSTQPEPAAVISLGRPSVISLDRAMDRLYIGSGLGDLYIFDNASQLSSQSSPRSVVDVSGSVRSLAIDACRNRLYVGFGSELQGFSIFVYNNASGLTGMPNPFSESQARIGVPENQVVTLALDAIGNLYYWPSNSRSVRVIEDPHNLAGAYASPPYKTILGVGDDGYSFDVTSH